jgi:hypothetical protein
MEELTKIIILIFNINGLRIFNINHINLRLEEAIGREKEHRIDLSFDLRLVKKGKKQEIRQRHEGLERAKVLIQTTQKCRKLIIYILTYFSTIFIPSHPFDRKTLILS